MKYIITAFLVFCATALQAQSASGYQRPPEEIARLVEAPLTPTAVFGPNKAWMALLDKSEYPSIEELSRPELRIAGLRINPENFGPSRAIYFVGLKFRNIKEGKDYPVSGLPPEPQISSFSFSPDGKKASFLLTFPDRIELWAADLGNFSARKLTDKKVNATLGNAVSWLNDSNTIVFLAAASDGSAAPVKTRVPEGPVIEENLGKKAASRTYQDLLKNQYDEKLFEYHTLSQLCTVSLDGSTRTVGKPALHALVSPSPDGKMLLTRTVQRPYSYLVPVNLFPSAVNVVDLSGTVIRNIANIPLGDNIPIGFNAAISGPRIHSWRSDKPATLVWAEAQDGGDPRAKAEVRDKVMTWDAPFTAAPKELVSLPLRYAGVLWGNDNVAVVYEMWWATRKARVYQVNPSQPGTAKVLFDYSYEDAYADPGDIVKTTNAAGKVVMLLAGNKTYLTGTGASPEGDRPFLDELDLASGKTKRLWRSEAPYFETPIEILDPKGQFVTSRESTSEQPNYFVRNVGSKSVQQITSFPHPYPQLKDVKKQVLKYKRADGVELSANLYLPPGYQKEQGPLPTFLWAYPEEFKSKDNAGQMKGSPYAFTKISWGSPIYWVVRGYAILDDASIPIVGEGDAEPNDTYVQQLVASAKAAIDYAASLGYVDPKRVGVGGHSYGAFMTANLLAHSDLFKAGIARSGAYNRTLTPFGFQQEERTYWEAPEVYYNMSPFSHADKIKTPILLVHGEADNNSGTFPIQTERFYNAIKGHGGTARYVLLPYESHGYRAKESILHMLWEMDNMLETYVKGEEKMKAKIETK